MLQLDTSICGGKTPVHRFPWALRDSSQATTSQTVSPGAGRGTSGPASPGGPCCAAGHVGEDQVSSDAVGVELPELGLQVLGVVSLADPGVAVGYRNHGHGVQKTGVFERVPNPPPGQLAKGVQQLRARIVCAQQRRQWFVGHQHRLRQRFTGTGAGIIGRNSGTLA